jgi:Cu+-exporting ATPase
MKYIRHSLVLIAILAMTFTGCRNNQFSTKSLVNHSDSDVEEPYNSPKQIKMNIEGMVCAVGCAAMIEKNLNKTKWIKFAKVDFESKEAVLTYDAHRLTTNDITQVVLNTSSDYLVTDLELID